MIESLIAPVSEWLIKKGQDKIKESAEFQNTRLAIRQAVVRELRLNRAFIDEVIKLKEDVTGLTLAMAEELEVSAFNKLEDSFMPIELFFDCERPALDEESSDGQFLNWASQLENEALWVERIYMRLRILRARWRCSKVPKNKSVQYVRWLIDTWLKQQTNRNRTF
ncbi:hypothetical protein [Thiosulfativibrio zosterae]|uniref:Uncharacterized protein n=1 Tax=Thiosulfativibrio zosterae TaxID=2675053 RepID=A0A6F8PLX5_9GAMM|nr:hypothetical protein [Thiosulfativibrio zosterae]BBP43112.1 hypothetical protein THMIRHAT_08580 [Thiosulfativibrio zosterae]